MLLWISIYMLLSHIAVKLRQKNVCNAEEYKISLGSDLLCARSRTTLTHRRQAR